MASRKADNILAYYRPFFRVDISDPTCILSVQKIKKQKLTGKPGDVQFTFSKEKNRYYDTDGNCSFTGMKVILNQTELPLPPTRKDEEAEDFFNTGVDPFDN